jgi:hypothetical protein
LCVALHPIVVSADTLLRNFVETCWFNQEIRLTERV